MWFAVLLCSLSDDTDRLSLSVREVSGMIKSDMANFTCVWTSESLIEDDFTYIWVLWLVSVVWNISLLINIINNSMLLWLIRQE